MTIQYRRWSERADRHGNRTQLYGPILMSLELPGEFRRTDAWWLLGVASSLARAHGCSVSAWIDGEPFTHLEEVPA